MALTQVTDLALVDPGILERSGAKITPTSLTLNGAGDYESFEELGTFIGNLADASNWWLADWLIQGEMLYGDKIAQAAEVTRRAPQTCINVASVGRRVHPDRRNPSLSFSAHAEVAALEPAEQKSWLKVAENERLTTAELRARIRDTGPDVQERERCGECGRPL